MCELLGINSRKRIEVNRWIREFYSHSEKHSHGWGMAQFYGSAVQLEKEPMQANASMYLHSRINHPIIIDNLIGHIRLASVGNLSYENTHPFVKHDNRGRCWTLAHNGTIFDFPLMDAYKSVQEGTTDSERILYYLLHQINKRQDELDRALEDEERFLLLEQLITGITRASGPGSRGNKLNLLLWDGQYMYVHSNYADTLFVKQTSDSVLFATTPLDKDGDWRPLPFLRLLVYRQGNLVFEGQERSTQYFDRIKDEEYQYLNYNLM